MIIKSLPFLCALFAAAALQAADDYQPGPDSKPQDGVPQGDVIKGTFDESKIFPGTWREYWVYVPKQLDGSKPAPVMVFQDGLQSSATNVFNNALRIDLDGLSDRIAAFPVPEARYLQVRALKGKALFLSSDREVYQSLWSATGMFFTHMHLLHENIGFGTGVDSALHSLKR